MSILATALLGALLGVEHSLEPDHLIAVSALATEEDGARRASLIGLSWGFGHALVLWLLGALVLVTRFSIPARFASMAELLVAATLVVLGVRSLARARSARVHLHSHHHLDRGAFHTHFHRHGEAGEHRHSHRPIHHGSLLIGMLHGMAGSAALLLLILGTVGSVQAGLVLLLAFGVGSTLGMAGVSALIGVALKTYAARLSGWREGLAWLVGLVSLAAGALLAVRTLISL